MRINRQINARQVRLIDHEGNQVGIVDTKTALLKAEEVGLDLVEISPLADPPVCKIIDYGKYLFEQAKKHKHKSKQVQTKELKLRPVTEIGDYTVKIRKATEFLNEGNKVKFTIKFRGRELAYNNLGVDMLTRITNDLRDVGEVEQQAKMEGRQMVMVVMPAKNKPQSKRHL